MAKKDFSTVGDNLEINPLEQIFSSTPAAASTDLAEKKGKEYSAQEVQQAQEEHATQGKKGMKLPRRNISLTPSNLEYIEVMAGVRGETYSEIINALISKSKEENAELFEEAKKFKGRL